MAFIPPPHMSAPPPSAALSGLSGMSLSPDGQRENSAVQGGSVMKMFYSIEKALETLSAAIPSEADKLDSIKSSLRECLNSVLSGGPQQDNGPNLLKGGAESD